MEEAFVVIRCDVDKGLDGVERKAVEAQAALVGGEEVGVGGGVLAREEFGRP